MCLMCRCCLARYSGTSDVVVGRLALPFRRKRTADIYAVLTSCLFRRNTLQVARVPPASRYLKMGRLQMPPSSLTRTAKSLVRLRRAARSSPPYGTFSALATPLQRMAVFVSSANCVRKNSLMLTLRICTTTWCGSTRQMSCRTCCPVKT